MRNLLKAVFKTGSGAMANLLLGVVSVKVMAVMLGPSGTGLFSLIRQLTVTFAAFGAGGQTAVIQGLANKTGRERDSYIRTTFWLFVLGGGVSALLIVLFAPEIAFLVFSKKDADLVDLTAWLALPVILQYAYIYLKSILNGFRAIGRLAVVEMLGPLATLILVYPVCVFVGEGYALAFVWLLCAAQLLMVVASFLILYKNGWLSALLVRERAVFARPDMHYFLAIAGTTFITGIMGAATLLAVRTLIAKNGGLYQAGLFDLAWSLSMTYVMLLLGAFGTYYTPTLSKASGNMERVALVRRVIRLSTLLMIPMIVTVVVLKPLLIIFLYSKEYVASLEMVRWMLIGDFLKVTSWVLAIPVIVNGDMRIYFWTETFWYMSFLALSSVAVLHFQELQGIGVAFIVLYSILVVYYLHYLRKTYDLRLTRDLVLPWMIGFSMVVLASFYNWSNSVVDWTSSSLWIIGSFGLSFLLLGGRERLVILNKIQGRLGIN